VATTSASGTWTSGGTVNPGGIPAASIDGTSGSVGATETTFNISLTAAQNAIAVIGDWINRVRCKVGGLPPINLNSDGTITTAGTIPAQTLTNAGTNGASCPTFASATAAMQVVKNNMTILTQAWNDVLVAIGALPIGVYTPIADPLGGYFTYNQNPVYGGEYTLSAATASVVGVAGPPDPTIYATAAIAFFTTVANDMATIAASYNSIVLGTATDTALTDSSTGTATSYPYSLTTNATPAAVADAATTSAPKAGFDTALGVLANTISSLAAYTNNLLNFVGQPPLIDNTNPNSQGGPATVSLTLAAETHALTATTASPNCVDVVTASARMQTINNSLLSIATQVSRLMFIFNGEQGVSGFATSADVASMTLAPLPITAAGVGGGSALITMLNTSVNTWLQNTSDSVATLAAALNTMTGTNATPYYGTPHVTPTMSGN
jgi:hypothetical protein